ncbi:unnamed protein product [Ascophyllum nodosum]
MPRADGYKTLPDDNDAGERTEDRGEAEADGAPTRREGTAAGAAPSSAGAGSTEAATAKDAGSEKQEGARKGDGDLGGLPTAEGVFVGDPVAQSLYPNPAPVITPVSHQYNLNSQASQGRPPSGVSITTGGHHVVTSAAGGMHHTVFLVDPRGFYAWGRVPQAFVCNSCGFSGMTSAFTDPCSNAPILAAACCCLVGFWPCSFIPFLIPSLRDTVHQCPGCGLTVGRSQQFR